MKIAIVISQPDFELANDICKECGYEIPHSYNRKGNVVIETKDITPWLKKLKFGIGLVSADPIIRYRRKLEKTVLQIIPLKQYYRMK